MSQLEHLKELAIKHWPVLAAGTVGLFIIYKYMGTGSASTSSTNTSGYAALAQVAAQNQQLAAQQQQVSDQYNLASQQLTNTAQANASAAAVANTQALGGLASSIGTALSNIVASQSILPATAMNDATTAEQTALTTGAGVAAASIAALPGSLSGAAKLAQASYAPITGYGSAVAGIAGLVGTTGTNALNSVATATGTATQAAGSAAGVTGAAGAAASAQATSSMNTAIQGIVSPASTMNLGSSGGSIFSGLSSMLAFA
jgi:hypothetical protein